MTASAERHALPKMFVNRTILGKSGFLVEKYLAGFEPEQAGFNPDW